MSTKIEWADETWSPVTGCTPISEGCKNCYAERMSKRLGGRFGYPQGEPFRVTEHPGKLDRPAEWKKPRRVFVCSMGDLFHENVSFKYIDRIWDVFYQLPRHTFSVLTKRPGRMLEYLERKNKRGWLWPLSNVHLGTSISTQEDADRNVSLLLQCLAAKRFVSCEPLLGPISFNLATDCDRQCNEHQEAHCPGTTGKCIGQMDIDQVIVGAETGPKKRHMDLDWARSIRNQCITADVPFFFKRDSDGNRELDGKLWNELVK